MQKRERINLVFGLVLVLTTLLVVFFRFYRLGSVPQGLTKDESYYGYDAYSILKTGRDIWDRHLPLYFKSTGEYKMNLTYLMVPGVKLFGLSEMTVRLPSAIFGLLTLFILFLTLQKFFSNRPLSLALTAAYAFSPLSFGMSRLFYESNTGLFFIALALLLVFNKRFTLSAIFFALSGYLYNPYRYIGLILLVLALALHYYFGRKDSRPVRRLLPLAIYLLIFSPLVIFGTTGGSLKRLGEELTLQKTSYEMKINDMRANCLLNFKSPTLAKLCYPFWNKVVLHTSMSASSFLRPLSPEILFLENQNEYVIPKGYGVFQSFLLPFYFLGLIWLFGFAKLKPLGDFERLLILFGIIASSGIVASTGNIEIYRHPVLMYLIYLSMSCGAYLFLSFVLQQKRAVRITISIFFFALASFQITKYLLTYHLYTQKLPLLFSYDVREIYEYLETKKDYQFIVDRKFHGPITASFFWATDPAYYQENIVWTDPDPWGFINSYRLGNVYSQTYTLNDLLCKKHANPGVPIRAVVIDDPGIYHAWADLLTHDFSGSLTLHAVYDIDRLYPFVKEYYPADLCKLTES